MLKTSVAIALLLVCALNGLSQTAENGRKSDATTSVATSATAANALARAALAAHGGDKLKQMKTLVIKGSLDLTIFNQSTPATFSTAISGEKYSFIINSPFQPLKQIYDGTRTFSSIQGFSLPPVTSLGFPVLPRVGEAGYTISALVDGKKKKAGFRITTPEGYYTDFFVDEKTNQVTGYESSYEFDGRLITTSVAIDKCLSVEGVLVPEKYSQRFDLGQMTAYASFKAKEIIVNSTLADDVFAIPK